MAQPRGDYPPAVVTNDRTTWIAPDDFPEAARTEGFAGSTQYRLLVNQQGQPTACEIVWSNVPDEVDNAACNLLMERAQFPPGAAEIRQFTSMIDWASPETRAQKAEERRENQAALEQERIRRELGEQFGSWFVIKETDELDPTNIVRVHTVALTESGERRRFSFVVIGGSFTGFMFEGARGWPYCELERSSFMVDGRAADYINSSVILGLCDELPVNPSVISQFRRGSLARVRVQRVDYTVRLDGFSAAYARAMALSR